MELNIKQNKNIRNENYYRIKYKLINQILNNYIQNNCKGDLYLANTPIKKLPENIKIINGDLDIRHTNISQLPNNLIICDTLNISYTNISVLPDDIIIYGDLWCYQTPLEIFYTNQELKNKYNIKGNIHGIDY